MIFVDYYCLLSQLNMDCTVRVPARMNRSDGRPTEHNGSIAFCLIPYPLLLPERSGEKVRAKGTVEIITLFQFFKSLP
jgi:hypothetical protein